MSSAPLKKLLAVVGAFALLGSLAVGAGAASLDGVAGPVGSLLAELGVGGHDNGPPANDRGQNIGPGTLDSDVKKVKLDGEPACREATQHALEVLKARLEEKEAGKQGIENAIKSIENCGKDIEETEEEIGATSEGHEACSEATKHALEVLEARLNEKEAGKQGIENAIDRIKNCGKGGVETEETAGPSGEKPKGPPEDKGRPDDKPKNSSGSGQGSSQNAPTGAPQDKGQPQDAPRPPAGAGGGSQQPGSNNAGGGRP